MKTNNIFRLLTLALAAMAFAFVTSCEGPAGPAGLAGADGSDGADGAPGQDINETCKQCHNSGTDALNTAQQQFGESGHSVGTYYDRSGECAGCHNTEGFISRVGLTGADEWAAVSGTSAKTQISCYTCHNVHASYTEADWGLTNTAQVVTLLGQADATDLQESYTMADLGATNNLCIQCHQSRDRGGVPTPTSTEDVSITSSHWGPHYGIQGQVFLSYNTAGYVGTETYPTAGAPMAQHASLSCTACHMGDGADHSLAVQYSACTECHDDAEQDVEDLNAEIHTSLYALGAYLRDNYDAMTGDDTDGYSPKSSSTPYPAKVGRAVWSYMTVYQDHSYGAHNPKYIKALIANSMEEIEIP